VSRPVSADGVAAATESPARGWVDARGALPAVPALILFMLTVAFPILSSLFLAFTDKKIGTHIGAVSLANFAHLLFSPEFWRSADVTLRYVGADVSLKIVGAYILATVAHRAGRRAALGLGAMLIPWLVPASAAVLLWLWLCYQPGGVIDHYVLHPARPILGNLILLGSPAGAFWSLVVLSVWRELPFWAILLLSVRRAVPVQLIEEARLHSGSVFFEEWHVFGRKCGPAILIFSAFATMLTLNEFQAIHLLTRGGPADSTRTISYYAFELGFKGIELGLAIACALLGVLLALPVVGFLLRKGEYHASWLR